MDISFLLPTNREHKYAFKFIDTLNQIKTDYKYEILVCSPSQIMGENVVSLKDNIQEGPILAFNEMAKIARGNYFVCVVDDHIPVDNGKFFDFVKFLESDFYTDRKFRITSFYTNHLPQRIPILGEDWCGEIKEEHNNRKHITVRFPIVSKETYLSSLKEHIFHPRFKYHAGDLWLGFFMGEEEFPCIECPSQIYQYIGLNNYKYRDRDCKLYHELKNNYYKGYTSYV